MGVSCEGFVISWLSMILVWGMHLGFYVCRMGRPEGVGNLSGCQGVPVVE